MSSIIVFPILASDIINALSSVGRGHPSLWDDELVVFFEEFKADFHGN